MADVLAMAEAYQQTAMLAAAVRTGVADALCERPDTAEALAASCELDPRGLRALLGGLAALGLAEQADDGAWRLSADGASLARSHPQSAALIIEKEFFFYAAWATLDQAVRDGHARIDPWRARLAAAPAQSHAFLRALDDLAERFGGELAELALPLPQGRLLDAGGGAGSHAARLAASTGMAATVLDLPEVEPVLRECHPELAFLAGDLRTERFGRPAGETWEVVLLANILHDHPPAVAAEIVSSAASLLAPDGVLLVYDWLLAPTGDRPPVVALFNVMMLVENEGGAAYGDSQIGDWLRAASLPQIEVRRGRGPIAVIRAQRSH